VPEELVAIFWGGKFEQIWVKLGQNLSKFGKIWVINQNIFGNFPKF